MTTTDLQVQVGSPNGDGKRDIIYRYGGREYPDCVDVQSGWQREQSLKRALDAFALPAENLSALDSEIARLASEADRKMEGGNKGIDYGEITAATLAQQDHRIEYLIPNVLAAGQHCLLGGPHKSLKSLVAADLAVSLTLAGHFLGFFRVARAAKTILMSGECGWPVLQDNLRRTARAAGHNLADLSGLMVSDKLPMFGSPNHADAMGQLLRDNEIEVGILDCAYLCMPMDGGTASNVFLMGTLLRSLADVFVENNATMILLHHATKAAGSDGQPIRLENLSFAGFREFSAQWILLSRHVQYVPGSGHHDLWLSTGGRAGHSGCWNLVADEGEYVPDAERRWDVAIYSRDEAQEQVNDRRAQIQQEKAEAALESDRRAIVGMMVKLKTPPTKTELRDRAPFGHGRFSRAFSSLVDDGTVEPLEIHKGNNRKYEAWTLRTTD